ncbi:hypothetical protein BCV53_07080 [Parageobacillus thermoglucosidasius]|uniref:Uncharacterized protein n=1 Tax=Parageobacillus thermoglucosidasius TaxID=1426 RepID=A0AAN0YN41_PARTM|nr:hypothetical protein AOT13_07070 [Parageobacillus thermoglucosidasius]MBY6272125.1 hypothetical protein [Bacillaceae bacterium]ANZ29856.1 hypothetical protein BCV53_07080 [Parageobacillus thermoglucosidasius]APM80594.1 hypothetical protein BCV54_07085 [Parageobacillus thermoglucosidasius]KJX70402.1 hypothetical protein WH82_01970 [Parageobacillus thermoglucosidasius]
MNKVYMGLLFRAPSTNQNLKLFKWNFQLATRGKGGKGREAFFKKRFAAFFSHNEKSIFPWNRKNRLFVFFQKTEIASHLNI